MRRWLQGAVQASWWSWGEATLITALALLSGFYLNPEDPFFVREHFPWTWFAPVLVALRYGMAPGLFSTALIVITFAMTQSPDLHTVQLPKMYFLGGLILTMLCGEYGTLWTDRIRRARQLSDYAEERLEQLSRAYYMTRLSHDRMEQNLISKPVTLRGALGELRGLLARQGARLDPENAQRFLGLLAHYCSLQSAALYLLDDGHPAGTPVARIGQGAELAHDDALLRRCLEDGATTYHAVNELDADTRSRYLVAAPLRVSDGRLLGVLLVEDMPFLALHRETLQILSVLLGYFADEMHASAMAAGLLQRFPDCPPRFAAEVLKLARLHRELGIDSALVALFARPHPRRNDILLQIQRMQRGLDYLWRTRRQDTAIVVTLMPFSGQSAVEGYVARLDSALRQDFGIAFGDGPLSVQSSLLSDTDPERLLRELLESAHAH
ncbi:MAG: PelD GGDEF domain-containing protein [Pseudomonadota bacterium]